MTLCVYKADMHHNGGLPG